MTLTATQTMRGVDMPAGSQISPRWRRATRAPKRVAIIAIAALGLSACGGDPVVEACHDKLVGLWLATELVAGEDFMGVEPGEQALFAWYVERRDDGRADVDRQYQLPDRPGRPAPQSTRELGMIDGWLAGPPGDATKADCSLALTSQVPDALKGKVPEDTPYFDDIKFDGPDTHVMVRFPEYVFKRQPDGAKIPR